MTQGDIRVLQQVQGFGADDQLEDPLPFPGKVLEPRKQGWGEICQELGDGDANHAVSVFRAVSATARNCAGLSPMAWLTEARRRPRSFRARPVLVRSNRVWPSCSSNCWMCRATVGWASPRCFAARAPLPGRPLQSCVASSSRGERGRAWVSPHGFGALRLLRAFFWYIYEHCADNPA